MPSLNLEGHEAASVDDPYITCTHDSSGYQDRTERILSNYERFVLPLFFPRCNGRETELRSLSLG